MIQLPRLQSLASLPRLVNYHWYILTPPSFQQVPPRRSQITIRPQATMECHYRHLPMPPHATPCGNYSQLSHSKVLAGTGSKAKLSSMITRSPSRSFSQLVKARAMVKPMCKGTHTVHLRRSLLCQFQRFNTIGLLRIPPHTAPLRCTLWFTRRKHSKQYLLVDLGGSMAHRALIQRGEYTNIVTPSLRISLQCTRSIRQQD